jgi:hypothetical protein
MCLSVKAIVASFLALLVSSTVSAAWGDLRLGMDEKAVLQRVGMPLMQNRGKGGAATWTYDCGGHILFQNGRVTFWDEPDAKNPPAPSAGTTDGSNISASQPGRGNVSHKTAGEVHGAPSA